MTTHTPPDDWIGRIIALTADLPQDRRGDLLIAIAALLESYNLTPATPWSFERFSSGKHVPVKTPTEQPTNTTADDARRFREAAEEVGAGRGVDASERPSTGSRQ
jgi:hypothetical protein